MKHYWPNLLMAGGLILGVGCTILEVEYVQGAALQRFLNYLSYVGVALFFIGFYFWWNGPPGYYKRR